MEVIFGRFYRLSVLKFHKWHANSKIRKDFRNIFNMFAKSRGKEGASSKNQLRKERKKKTEKTGTLRCHPINSVEKRKIQMKLAE